MRNGQIRYREDILDGLEQAPGSIAGLYRGENLGTCLIRIAPKCLRLESPPLRKPSPDTRRSGHSAALATPGSALGSSSDIPATPAQASVV